MYNMDKGNRERLLNLKLDALSLDYSRLCGCAEIAQRASTVQELLEDLSAAVHQRFPIISHRYSLCDQVLVSSDKAQTDCRFSATLLGLFMIEANCFDLVALCHQSSADIHIGVVGIHENVICHAHFFDDRPGYKVSVFTPQKLAENKLVRVDAKGILKLDRDLMVS